MSSSHRADATRTRTPARFRERLLDLFRAPDNLAYLRRVFTRQMGEGRARAFVLDTLEAAAYAYEQGEDLIYSDPIAQRGDGRPALDLWSELRRINRAFYESRMRFIRDQASLLVDRKPVRPEDVRNKRQAMLDTYDDEPYHYRMFVADSLRPPGLEELNDEPLHGINEDHYSVRLGCDKRGAAVGAPGAEPMCGVDPLDWGWDRGDAARTATQAIEEYWGEGATASSPGPEPTMSAKSYGDTYAWGDHWQENGGTRFMRYEEIPFWQHTARALDSVEHDIDDTLGQAPLELGSHVRRWDMDRLREPRGREYRRYGQRSGYVV